MSQATTTPDKTLAEHQITKALKALGLSDEELDCVRFRRHQPGERFESWPITWPPHLDILGNPQLSSALRDFAALRHALLDGPATGDPDQCYAWERVGEALTRAYISAWSNQVAVNRQNAQAPRALIKPTAGDPVSMRSLVSDYVNKPENRELQARDLWPGFLPYFADRTGMTIWEEGAQTYVYGDKGRLKFRTFRNYVRDARSKSH